MRMSAAIAGLSTFLLSGPPHAAVISYELTDLGGDQFRYDYTVANDGAFTSEVALFDIFFDPLLYDEFSLAIVSDPALAADWDQLLFSSLPDVPAAFDALALGPGLAVGGTVSGFAVQFRWLGAGSPGAQDFEIYDPSTFEFLGGARTTLVQPPVPVPEPATAALFAIGTVLLVLLRWRRRAVRSAGYGVSAQPHCARVL